MPPENTPAFAVVYADKAFGRSVAETLVQSFYVKFGPSDPKTIEAQAAFDRLCGAVPPFDRTLAEAPVQIPNQRSSLEVRRAGRSID